jgi:hypothetical protein
VPRRTWLNVRSTRSIAAASSGGRSMLWYEKYATFFFGSNNGRYVPSICAQPSGLVDCFFLPTTNCVITFPELYVSREHKYFCFVCLCRLPDAVGLPLLSRCLLLCLIVQLQMPESGWLSIRCGEALAHFLTHRTQSEKAASVTCTSPVKLPLLLYCAVCFCA